MLKVKNLTRRYKNFMAVDSISFEVKKGEIFGVLGPNGAGKSTLMKMLNGFLKPSSGDATIDGQSIKEPEKIKPLIGWAPQEDSFYSKLTVAENLSYFGSLYNLDKETIKAHSAKLLDLLGLANKKDAIAETLSGGMKKRLSIAIALIHEPKLIFLDEPTVGVDPISRNALLKVIKEIKNHGITILYTSHYLQEVEQLCDRMAIIQSGKLLTITKPAELKKKFGKTLEEAFIKVVSG